MPWRCRAAVHQPVASWRPPLNRMAFSPEQIVQHQDTSANSFSNSAFPCDLVGCTPGPPTPQRLVVHAVKATWALTSSVRLFASSPRHLVRLRMLVKRGYHFSHCQNIRAPLSSDGIVSQRTTSTYLDRAKSLKFLTQINGLFSL